MKPFIQRVVSRNSSYQKLLNRSLTHVSSGGFFNTNVATHGSSNNTMYENKYNHAQIGNNKTLMTFMSSYDQSGLESNAGGDNEIRLYVGNLDFSVDEDGLRQAFEDFGTVTAVKIPLDRETQNPRGFGFVTLSSTTTTAKEIISKMDQSELYGRMIKVSEPFDRRPSARYDPTEFNAAGSEEVKLYVGNLDFDTQEGHVIDMFERYGTVVDSYFPTDRETGNKRGFAFITMAAADAEVACQQLNGQDVDGRSIRVNEAQPKGTKKPSNSYGGGQGDGYRGGYSNDGIGSFTGNFSGGGGYGGGRY